MLVERKIEELGFRLPPAPTPVGIYVPAVRSGNLIFTSGTLPLEEGQLKVKGKIGEEELSLEDGYRAARLCALNALSAIKDLIGDLDKIKRIIKATGFINSAFGFTEQAKVLNGASEFLKEVFGEKGSHARAAIGASDLPLNAPVELDLIVEVE